MTELHKNERPITSEELTHWRLIEKGLITREEFIQKISEERAAYQSELCLAPFFSPRL